MDYFYCTPEKISHNTVTIDGDEFNHLIHVMRKKEGDHIRVIDGIGTAYDVQLINISRRFAQGMCTAIFHNYNEPPVSITLAVGILKNPSRFDFLVEKVTELGVRTIVPLLTKRTIPSHAKIDRWQKLALAGMKQCGRSVLPTVKELLHLGDFLTQSQSNSIRLLAHEAADEAITLGSQLHKKASDITILIGPEGGFDDDELDECKNAGFTLFSLGKRRLRTETAAIAASSLIVSAI